jgi:hypothetical protein
MVSTRNAELWTEEMPGPSRDGSPKHAWRELEVTVMETLSCVESVPGQWHPQDWVQVRLQLEQAPEGVWYRGHHVAWVDGPRRVGWLHEVDRDEEHRFATLAQALLFIDILET